MHSETCFFPAQTLQAHTATAHHMRNTRRCPALVQEEENPTQTGDKVRFRVSDVFLPSLDAVLAAPPGEGELEGTIVDFSDSGQKARVFALVDIVKRQTVVVPVEKLHAVPGPELEHGS